MRLDVNVDWQEARKYRCLVDGVDVTDRCFAADDIEGWADCFIPNAPSVDSHGRRLGGFEIDLMTHSPKVERLQGKVEFVLR